MRRRGIKPTGKPFDNKTESETWARGLVSQVGKFGAAPDARILESATVGAMMKRDAE